MSSDTLALLPLALAFVVFPIVGWVILRLAPRPVRVVAFALLNVLTALLLTALTFSKGVRRYQARDFVPIGIAFLILYLTLIAIQYLNLILSQRKSNAYTWIGVAYPLVLLAVIKYVPGEWNPLQRILDPFPGKVVPEFFLGISYIAFRLSHMVYEVRNGIAERPTFWEFLGFAFFVPTFSIGPISPFSRFQKSLHSPIPADTAGPAVLRILVGATKYFLVANLFSQLSYRGLLFDGHPHHVGDLAVAIFAYCLFLYCNFSGYCDIAIGVSALLGISVMENFNDPFLARNLQEFWNRWHISLSTYLRDMMFTPLSKALVRRFGPASSNHMIAITIFAVFVVVGVWHGTGWNFVLFGVWHGIGLVVCHYYTVFLKKRLGKQGYMRYQENQWAYGAGVVVTFVYFSCGLFLMANTMQEMQQIYRIVR